MSPVLKKYFSNGFSKDFISIFLPEKTKILSVGHQDVDAKEGCQCPRSELRGGELSRGRFARGGVFGVNCLGRIVRG